MSTDDTGVSTPARGSFRILIDPVFGPFFVGKLLSTTGNWVHSISAAIVMFQLTSSAVLVGAVSIAQFGPQLLLTPWSGARADRGDRRRQLVLGRAVSAAGSAGLVGWIVVMDLQGTGGVAALIASAFVVGIGYSLGGPALHALLPSLVRPSELATAVALNSAPFTIGRAAGPALGALLVIAGGPILAFGVATAAHAAFAVILLLLPIRGSGHVPAKDTRIRAGLRHVRTDPAIMAILLGSAAVGIGADPVITLTPSIAENLGAGPTLVGALASSFGAGAGAAFVVLGRLRGRFGMPRLATAGLLLMAAGLAGLAVSPAPAPALASMAVAGAGMTLSLTGFSTLLQQRSPEHLRGRLMALWSVAFVGSRPLAAGLNGAVADLLSAAVALAVVVAILLLVTWLARPSRTEP